MISKISVVSFSIVFLSPDILIFDSMDSRRAAKLQTVPPAGDAVIIAQRLRQLNANNAHFCALNRTKTHGGVKCRQIYTRTI